MEKLTEINETESARISGGALLPSLLAGLIIAGTVQILSDRDNFKNGIAGRLEVPRP